MDIQYFGANCLKITTKKANIVIDDNLSEVGSKAVSKETDTVLTTTVQDEKPQPKAKLNINQPGEYEVADTSIVGIPTRVYKDDDKAPKGTIFKLENEDVKVAVIGNSSPDLSDAQLEMLGEVDILIIPVGGNGTLSGSDALKIIKKIEPYVVIPTFYAEKGIKYKEPQASLEDALKELAMEPSETTQKLKLKSSNFTEGDAIKLVVLEV